MKITTIPIPTRWNIDVLFFKENLQISPEDTKFYRKKFIKNTLGNS